MEGDLNELKRKIDRNPYPPCTIPRQYKRQIWRNPNYSNAYALMISRMLTHAIMIAVNPDLAEPLDYT